MEMDTDLVLDVEDVEDEAEQTSRTYRIDFENGCIDGMIDGLEAVKQAITKIMLTERFKNLIYSEDYGNEIKDMLMNADNTDAFTESETPALVKEALLNDDRILSIDDFEIYDSDEEKDGVMIEFDVDTIYGKYRAKEVI